LVFKSVFFVCFPLWIEVVLLFPDVVVLETWRIMGDSEYLLQGMKESKPSNHRCDSRYIYLFRVERHSSAANTHVNDSCCSFDAHMSSVSCFTGFGGQLQKFAKNRRARAHLPATSFSAQNASSDKERSFI
jgi:hypothetical protein